MTINEQAIEAASISLAGPKYAFLAREDAKRALEAAMPHIRKQIAEEINAIEDPPLDDRGYYYVEGWDHGVSHAADIVEGKS